MKLFEYIFQRKFQPFFVSYKKPKRTTESGPQFNLKATYENVVYVFSKSLFFLILIFFSFEIRKMLILMFSIGRAARGLT